jgi:hypothetical protein
MTKNWIPGTELTMVLDEEEVIGAERRKIGQEVSGMISMALLAPFPDFGNVTRSICEDLIKNIDINEFLPFYDDISRDDSSARLNKLSPRMRRILAVRAFLMLKEDEKKKGRNFTQIEINRRLVLLDIMQSTKAGRLGYWSQKQIMDRNTETYIGEGKYTFLHDGIKGCATVDRKRGKRAVLTELELEATSFKKERRDMLSLIETLENVMKFDKKESYAKSNIDTRMLNLRTGEIEKKRGVHLSHVLVKRYRRRSRGGDDESVIKMLENIKILKLEVLERYYEGKSCQRYYRSLRLTVMKKQRRMSSKMTIIAIPVCSLDSLRSLPFFRAESYNVTREPKTVGRIPFRNSIGVLTSRTANRINDKTYGNKTMKMLNLYALDFMRGKLFEPEEMAAWMRIIMIMLEELNKNLESINIDFDKLEGAIQKRREMLKREMNKRRTNARRISKYEREKRKLIKTKKGLISVMQSTKDMKRKVENAEKRLRSNCLMMTENFGRMRRDRKEEIYELEKEEMSDLNEVGSIREIGTVESLRPFSIRDEALMRERARTLEGLIGMMGLREQIEDPRKEVDSMLLTSTSENTEDYTALQSNKFFEKTRLFFEKRFRGEHVIKMTTPPAVKVQLDDPNIELIIREFLGKGNPREKKDEVFTGIESYSRMVFDEGMDWNDIEEEDEDDREEVRIREEVRKMELKEKSKMTMNETCESEKVAMEHDVKTRMLNSMGLESAGVQQDAELGHDHLEFEDLF